MKKDFPNTIVYVGDIVEFGGKQYEVREVYNYPKPALKEQHVKVKGLDVWIGHLQYKIIKRNTNPNNAKEKLHISMNRRLKERNPHVATYALRYQSDGVIYDVFHIRDICHARLVGREGAIAKEAVLHLGNYYVSGSLVRKQFKEYLDWLTKESPWKSIYLNTSSYALRCGMYLDTDRSIDHVLGATLAIRLATEYVDFLPTFFFWKEHGCTSEQAFYLSCFTRVQNRKIFMWCHGGGHHLISEYGSSHKGFIKFLKEGYYLKDLNPKLKDGASRFKIMHAIASGTGPFPKKTMEDAGLFKTVGEGWNQKIVSAKPEEFVTWIKKEFNE